MSLIYGKAITALVLAAMIAVSNLFGGIGATTDETTNEAAETVVAASAKADYETLISTMTGFTNITVFGSDLRSWSYEALQSKVMNELPEGEWISCPDASAKYSYDNAQYNATSADGRVSGFTNEETTTYKENGYVRKTAGYADENVSVNVTEQTATAGSAESYSRKRVAFRDATAYAYTDLVKLIDDESAVEAILESDEWAYEETFEDGSSVSFYTARPMTEGSCFADDDAVIRTVTYEKDNTRVVLGFGHTSLKEITVTETL